MRFCIPIQPSRLSGRRQTLYSYTYSSVSLDISAKPEELSVKQPTRSVSE